MVLRGLLLLKGGLLQLGINQGLSCYFFIIMLSTSFTAVYIFVTVLIRAFAANERVYETKDCRI